MAVNGKRPIEEKPIGPVEEKSSVNEPMITEIRELKSQGVAPPLIHQQLESKYPDLTIPMIIGVS
jgi:hypothetical protein